MATKSKTTRGNNHSTEDERLPKVRRVNDTILISTEEEPTAIEAKGNANIFDVNSRCDFSLPRRLPPAAPIVLAESPRLLDVEAPFSKRLLDLGFHLGVGGSAHPEICKR